MNKKFLVKTLPDDPEYVRTCKRKGGHTLESGTAERNRLVAEDGVPRRLYECMFCGMLHITKGPKFHKPAPEPLWLGPPKRGH